MGLRIGHSIFFGLLISTILSVVILRVTLFSPGLIKAYDFSFPYDKNTLLQSWFYAWNPIISTTNVELLSRLSLYAPLIVILPSIEIFERIIFFSMFALPSFVSFVVAFKLFLPLCKKTLYAYLASSISSIAYTLNPFYIFSGRIDFYLTYASLPALFYLTIRTFKEESNVSALQRAIGLSLIMSLLIFPQSIHGIAYSLALIMFIVIVELVLHVNKDLRKHYLRSLLIIFMSVMVPSFINAYAVLPHIMSGINDSFGPQIASGRLNINLIGTFTLKPFYALTASFPRQSPETGFVYINRELFPLWIFSCTVMVLPAYLFMTMLMKKKFLIAKLDRDVTVILSSLIIISPFLSSIEFTPLSSVYNWIFSNVPYAWGLLQFPYSFTFFTSFGLAFLLGFFCVQVYERLKSLKICFISVILISAVILFIAHPLLISGNYMHILNPSPLPDEYISANRFLQSDKEYFRTLWLPEYGALKSLPYGHPASWYMSTVPLITVRIAIGTDAYEGFKELLSSSLDELDESALFDLSFVGVKYIIYQNDTTLSSPQIFDSLLKQRELQLVFNDGSIWIFKNTRFQPFVRSLGGNANISYTRIEPTKWYVDVDSKNQFVLAFAEPYDRNWQAFIGENSLPKIQLFPGPINGFLVNQTGKYRITIEYKPQAWMQLGTYVSISTVLVIFVAFIYTLSVRNGRKYTFPA